MTTQFVTALELATYFNGTTDAGELSPEFIAQANILLQMISADVQAAAGVKLTEGSGSVVLPGTWSRDLALPAGPVRDVDAVVVNGSSIPSSSWAWNSRSIVRRGGSPIFGLDADEADAGLSPLSRQGAGHRSGLTWGGPVATISVHYSWGYAVVPDVVKSLVLRIAARTFGNVAGVTQESLAVYSVTYGASSANEGGSHVSDKERKRLRQALGAIRAGTVNVGGR